MRFYLLSMMIWLIRHVKILVLIVAEPYIKLTIHVVPLAYLNLVATIIKSDTVFAVVTAASVSRSHQCVFLDAVVSQPL